MSEPSPDGEPQSSSAIELRKLRFEARKFAIETLVRIQLDQTTGTRAYIVGHLRLMFTLALGALAGAMSIVGGLVRAGALSVSWPEDMIRISAIALCIGLFTLAAVLSLIQSRRMSREAASLLQDPFPRSDPEVKRLLSSGVTESEDEILDTLSTILRARVEMDHPLRTQSMLLAVLIILGLVSGGLAILMPDF